MCVTMTSFVSGMPSGSFLGVPSRDWCCAFWIFVCAFMWRRWEGRDCEGGFQQVRLGIACTTSARSSLPFFCQKWRCHPASIHFLMIGHIVFYQINHSCRVVLILSLIRYVSSFPEAVIVDKSVYYLLCMVYAVYLFSCILWFMLRMFPKTFLNIWILKLVWRNIGTDWLLVWFVHIKFMAPPTANYIYGGVSLSTVRVSVHVC